MIFGLACVAGGILGERNNALTAEPLKASVEAARRMGRSISRGFAPRDERRRPENVIRLAYNTTSYAGYFWVLIVFLKGLVKFMEIGS